MRLAKGCDSGIIDEVANADGSAFISLHGDLLSAKKDISRKADLENFVIQ